MVDQPWSDITTEVSEEAYQAGRDFASCQGGIQKDAFIKKVMDTKASIFRMKIASGVSVGNAQEISRLFASAAMSSWYKCNEPIMANETSNILRFPMSKL